MSICLRRLLAGAMLAGACLPALCAPSVEHEAAVLFGLEYDDIPRGSAIGPDGLSCVELETRPVRTGGAYRGDWQAAAAECSGRTVELLKRRVAERDGRPRWRIEDVLLLPALPDSGSRFLARDGECALDGESGTSFVALLRRRSGRAPAVDQVWAYDLDQGRLVQQPATRVVCNDAPE